MRILTVNAGSSSLKLRLLGDADELVAEEALPAERGAVARDHLEAALRRMGPADAVGHRVVHGGTRFHGPARVDDETIAALESLTDLAPLHQPAAISALRVVQDALPDAPGVVCFDTAFHAGLPAAAATYALPRVWRERFPLRRFGFHGLSHAYATRRAGEMLGRDPRTLRLVTCHLGAGASLAAVRDGRSVDTTMGFTPMEGLVMATRSGTVDPGLLLWLIEHGGLDVGEVSDALEHRAGLVGLAGTADMREVLARSEAGDRDAVVARDVYLHRLRALIAAMAAAMDGLDVLVFTGGVGENAAVIRQRAADGLGFLGVALDVDANARAVPDVDVSAPDARVRTLVVRAREDLEIAREVRAVLGD
ncbi:acetate/propionate family kinase [Thermasporomyces composti]|uniref:Acetate kinase n=1 Tax=Thermasporomyces composti TaxID=696763 RepID=A0A3D9V9P0_THECX|nr:acetate/propionate family kinase [Thermasporomyces composti]REF35715.1 acetate kinase [Thermasporomyces composti]